MPSPLATLLTMLTYKRPYRSKVLAQFEREYLSTLPGAFCDRFGNWHVERETPKGCPQVLWSSHTDTVHSLDGFQRVQFKAGTISLGRGATSSCLGADDTVGVWLMCEMIRAHVPGYYIFHAGEERGCLGSTDLAAHDSLLLEAFDCAIAFDRKGTDEIITHQLGERGCSDTFAWSLASQLPSGYRPSKNGVYTDTAQYFAHVDECTNISVGYYSQHSSHEWIDADHVLKLRAALLNFDPSVLVLERDCADYEPASYSNWDPPLWGHKGNWATPYRPMRDTTPTTLTLASSNASGQVFKCLYCGDYTCNADTDVCARCVADTKLGKTDRADVPPFCQSCGDDLYEDDDVDLGLCEDCADVLDDQRLPQVSTVCLECGDPLPVTTSAALCDSCKHYDATNRTFLDEDTRDIQTALRQDWQRRYPFKLRG